MGSGGPTKGDEVVLHDTFGTRCWDGRRPRPEPVADRPRELEVDQRRREHVLGSRRSSCAPQGVFKSREAAMDRVEAEERD
jgi:hypothetical protein